jgi:hypothetical protein
MKTRMKGLTLAAVGLVAVSDFPLPADEPVVVE